MPKDLTGDRFRRQVFDDDLERPESSQRTAKAFDKRQSWGVWILAGAFLLVVAAVYFLLSGPDKKPSETAVSQTEIESPQVAPQASEPTDEQPPAAEGVASKGPDAETPLTEDEQTNAPASQVDLEVADLGLWHDSLNNTYRADFSITNNQNAEDEASISGYAFVYLGFRDETSGPKTLLLPDGEMQAGKPAQISKGARFRR